MGRIFSLANIASFFFILFASVLCGYILLSNLAPFGLTTTYSSESNNKYISEFEPKNRIETTVIGGEKVYKQKDDLIYFTVAIPFNYDTADVKITLNNPSPEQNLYLGFQDGEGWHYNTKLIESPVLDTVTWPRVGSSPSLFQRKKKYSSFTEFLKKPSGDAVVGTYEYDPELLMNSGEEIVNYKPAKKPTIINTPLREKTIIYAYLKNEPFKMKIEKQDLNWYKDPDPVTINIYKDDSLVYTSTIDDDGITDDSKRTTVPQEVEIQNPGPGNPENGVYKIVIDASYDTIIKRIETNLHKIVFESPLFLAGNKDVYPKVVNITKPVKVYTNSLAVSATTNHEAAYQNIKVGSSILKVNSKESEVATVSASQSTEVNIPKSDIILKGLLGYFAFSKDQFFSPSSYKILPVTDVSDLDLIDYLVSDYYPPKMQGDWKTVEQTFNLESAVIKNGELSWVIKAPELKDYNRSVQIKDIEVTLIKKPLPIVAKYFH